MEPIPTGQGASAPRPIAPRPQLLTYPDSLGGDLRSLGALLRGPLAGLFRGLHILPPFPSSGDRGFAPTTYREIDPRFGDWADIRRLGTDHDVVLDLMINHLSRRSPEFQDFERRGRRSPYADLFVTLDKVWPDGDPPADDVARIFLRKPDAPFTTVTIAETGATERVWTSFGTADWSEQIDLDVTSPLTRSLVTEWLRIFADQGVRIVRLDAVGYVIKKPGTSCFMVEPEIWDFLAWVSGVAESVGLTVLPEVHAPYPTHEQLTAHGLWTYDFVLPGLVLHSLATGDGRRLAAHLARSPHRQFTTLDSHDGIPVRPDLDGLLEPDEMLALAELVVRRGGNVNRLLTPTRDVDVHQLNCTYYSALDCEDQRYLAARAIQLFARGVPQIYYVGLLAGENDRPAVAATGDGRAINRHDYTLPEIEAALRRPVVERLLGLIRLRNTHPAFDGELDVADDGTGRLRLRWRRRDAECILDVDLRSGAFEVRGRPAAGAAAG
ncbi:MAG TPA: sucrose phosphorylase [Candidatus Limnocylindrales bacterium]|nr:sucrose phosphorylase [Candidatus Limnocylindrales bacterium]